MKVKLFQSSSYNENTKEMEARINSWLKRNKGKIKNVQISLSTAKTSDGHLLYSVMVLYTSSPA